MERLPSARRDERSSPGTLLESPIMQNHVNHLAKDLKEVFKQSAKLHKDPDKVWEDLAIFVIGLGFYNESGIVSEDAYKKLGDKK